MSRGSDEGKNVAESTARIASQTPRARIQRKTRGRLARVALETLETRRMLTAVTNDKFYSDFWPMQIGVWFDTNVSSSLTASDLELTNLWQGAQMLANTDYVISDYDSENNQATFSVTYEPPTSGPEPAGILPDGDYEAIFSADGITDVNGEPMAADASGKYFFFAGDGNLDRAINADDYAIIDSYYGNPLASGYSQGDFNFSGAINADDLAIIDSRFGTVIPVLPTGDQSNYLVSSAAFGTNAITLFWNPPAENVSGFKVFRSTDGVNFVEHATVADPDARTWVDEGLAEGSKYTYRIRGYTQTGSQIVMSAATNKAWSVTNLPGSGQLWTTDITSTSVSLGWLDNAVNETAYEVWRSVGSNPAMTKVATLPANDGIGLMEFTDDGRTPETLYTYRVRAITPAATSIYSLRHEVMTAPAAPTGLTASLVSDDQVQLDWVDQSAAEIGFAIEWSIDGGVTYDDVLNIGANTTSYLVENVPDGATVMFHVIAQAEGISSDPSNEASVLMEPRGPENLGFGVVTGGSVELQWADRSVSETAYEVWQQVAGGAWVLAKTLPPCVPQGEMTTVVDNLFAEVSYSFKVRAKNPAGDVNSDVVDAETPALEVTLSSPSEDAYDGVSGTDYVLKLVSPGVNPRTVEWTIDWGDGTIETIPRGSGRPAPGAAPDGGLTIPYQYIAPVARDFIIVVSGITLNGDVVTDSAVAQVDPAPPEMRVALARFSFVYNNVRFEPSYGLMKGSDATEDTRAGNAWDQAQLLIDRLNGIDKFKSQNLKVASFRWGARWTPTNEVLAWLGVKDAAAATSVLRQAGLNPAVSGGMIGFRHAWVYVTFPSEAGFNLDPSWKFKDLPGAIRPALDGIGNTILTFDEAMQIEYEGLDGNETPFEFYEGKVAEYLRETSATAGLGLSDVPFDGPIIAKQFKALPGWTNDARYIAEPSSLAVNAQPDKQQVRVLLGTQAGFGNKVGVGTRAVTAPFNYNNGRYVRIRLNGEEQVADNDFRLSMVEVVVRGRQKLAGGKLGPSRNLVSRKRVEQSGTYSNGLDYYGPENAIDGKLGGTGDRYTLTDPLNPNAWWQIDLGKAYQIDAVEIWARTDETQTFRPTPFTVYVAALPFTGNSSADLTRGDIRSYAIDRGMRKPFFDEIISLPELGQQLVSVNYRRSTLSQSAVVEVQIGSRTVRGPRIPWSLVEGGMLRLDHLDPGETIPVDPDNQAKPLSTLKPSDYMSPFEISSFEYERAPGTPLGIGLGARQWSESSLMRMQGELNALAAAANPNAGVVEYQGKLLSLSAMRYLADVQLDRDGIGGLTQTIAVQRSVESAVMSGSPTLSFVKELADGWKMQNPALSSKFRLDAQGLSTPLVSTAGAAVIDSNFKNINRLKAWNQSALEHVTVQRVSNTDSISAVKGLQWAQKENVPIYKLTGETSGRPAQIPLGQELADFLNGSNKATVLGLFSEDDADASALSPSGAGGFLSDSKRIRNLIAGSLFDGYDVIVPQRRVRLDAALTDNGAPNPARYTTDSWLGAVWLQEKATSEQIPNTPWTRVTIEYKGVITSTDGQISDGGAIAFPSPGTPPLITTDQQGRALNAGDPVNLLTGNVEYEEPDIVIPNAGILLNFSRRYDSTAGALAELGALPDVGMGAGWVHTYSDYLTRNGNGSVVVWHTSTGEHHEFTKNPDGTFTNPKGLFGTFSFSGTVYSFRANDGFTRKFVLGNQKWRMTEMRDRNNNALLLSYTGGNLTTVADSQQPERKLEFFYDNTALPTHITRIRDNTGVPGAGDRTWRYTYVKQSSGKNLPGVSGFVIFLRTAGSPDLPSSETPGTTQTKALQTYYDYSFVGRTFGLLTRVKNTNTGAAHRFAYYANRRAFSTTDQLNKTEYFSYDLLERGFLGVAPTAKTGLATRYIDPLGRITTYKFDTAANDHQAKRIINVDRSRQDNVWQTGLLMSTQNDLGRQDQYQYDSNGNVTRHEQNLTDDESVVTTYTYDPAFNGVLNTTITTADGARTSSNQYDGNGNLTTSTDAEANQTVMTYTSRGLLQSVTRPRGLDADTQGEYTDEFKTAYVYDIRESGQITEVNVKLPDKPNWTTTTKNVYDNRGYLLTTTDADQVTITRTYDGLGHELSMTVPDPDGTGPQQAAVTTYGYVDGRRRWMTDARNPSWITLFEYDVLGRLTRTTYPGGSAVGTQFDAVGNIIAVENERKLLTEFYYDKRNRLTQTVYADGAFQRMKYDGGGRVIQVSEPLNDVTTDGLDPINVTSQNVYDLGNRLLLNRDAEGQYTTYDYNDFGDVTSQKFYVTKAAYNASTPWSVTNFVTDDLGRVTEQRSNSGSVSTIKYDADGNFEEQRQYDVNLLTQDPLTVPLTTAMERLTKTKFDGQDRPIAVTDALGFVSRTKYDDAGRVVATIDPRWDGTSADDPYVTAYVYDLAGRQKTLLQPPIKQVVGPDARPDTQYFYDQLGNVNKIIDPRLNETTYLYDERNRLNTVTNAQNKTATTIYLETGELLQQTDELGRITSFEYDERGRKIKETLPDAGFGNLVTRWEYNAAGNMVKMVVDPPTAAVSDRVTTYTYDKLHRVVTTTLPDPDLADNSPAPTIVNTYLHNDLASTKDELGYVTLYDYARPGPMTKESIRRPVGTPDAGPDVTLAEYQYDSFGNLLARTDYVDAAATKTEVTSYAYDKLNRKTLERRPDPVGGTSYLDTLYGYDAAGNLTVVVDPIGSALLSANPTAADIAAMGAINNHAVRYDYDALNRQTAQTLADPDRLNGGSNGALPAPSTTFTYDLAGNLARQIDPAGNVLSSSYDSLNRKTAESTAAYVSGFTGTTPSFETVTRTFGYDDVGNLASIIDRDGRTRSFGYDALNRQTNESWSDGRSMGFSYDDEGRRTGASDSGGPGFTYTYDNLGRMKSKSRSGGNVPAVQWSYAYDDAGNRTSAVAKQGATTLLSNAYVYDYMGAQRQVIQTVPAETSKTANFDFDLLGRPTAISRFNGSSAVAVSVYLYDGAGRLGSLSHAAGNSARGVYGMIRDKKDRITTLSVDGVSRPMSYDANDQLLGATTTDEVYAYDANGNRTLAKTADLLGVRAERAQVSGADNRIAKDGQSEYQYDKEGNRVAKLGGEFQFDIDAKAYPASPGSATASYAYDLRNRLVGVTKLTMDPGGAMITDQVIYTYDVDDNRTSRVVNYGDPATPDVNERYNYDGAELTLVFDATGAVSERILNDSTGAAIAIDKGAGNVRWLLGDQVGSIRQVIDDAGALKNKIDFDTVGLVRSETQPTESPRFNYAGGEIEKVTSLLHFGVREYEPLTGWLQQDPIGYAGGDANLNRYVGNNPAALSDRSGLYAQELSGRIPVSNFMSANLSDYVSSSDFADTASQYYGRERVALYSVPGGGYTDSYDSYAAVSGAVDRQNMLDQRPQAFVSSFVNSFSLGVSNYVGASDTSRYSDPVFANANFLGSIAGGVAQGFAMSAAPKILAGVAGEIRGAAVAWDSAAVGRLPLASRSLPAFEMSSPVSRAASETIGGSIVSSSFRNSSGAGIAEARHVDWANDASNVAETIRNLGQRSLRQAQGNGTQAERLFGGYLRGVNNRLERLNSALSVEWQPAAINGGTRVPGFIYFKPGNQLYAFPGSRRLDAGIVNLAKVRNGMNPVVWGFDITVDSKKPNIVQYYQQYFGNIPIDDIRLTK
jgi:RHS repeat-associated protein